MIQFLLITTGIFALATAIAVMIARRQAKRAKAAERQYENLLGAYKQVMERAERLQKALGATAKVKGAANAKRKELSQTPDSNLADRANGLFG